MDSIRRRRRELSDEDRAFISTVTKAFADKAINLKPGMFVTPGGGTVDLVNLDCSIEVVQSIVTPTTLKIADFAKNVPGFSKLPDADKIFLVKSCFADILCLRVAFLYDGKTQSLTLYNGHTVNQDNLDVVNLDLLLKHVYKYAVSLKKLHLDFTETALLVTMLLTASGRRAEIVDKVNVAHLKNQISRSFSRYVDQTQGKRWSKILMNMDKLRVIARILEKQFMNMMLDGSSRLSPMFLQLFSEPPEKI